MRLASARQMRELDNVAIYERQIPSTLLMERAAAGLLQACLYYRPATCAIFCGAGNNGGDGVALARLAIKAGVTVRAFLVGKREKITEDCREMERRLEAFGGKLEDFDPSSEEQKSCVLQSDVLVDALFGIGLNSTIRGDAITAVEWMNQSSAPTVSADIPSGVETDTGRVLGCAVRADVTVTFSMAKLGHFVGDGALHTGRLVIHDIGIPADLMETMAVEAHAIDARLVKSWLPERPADGHKGTFGKCYILAGATGYTGAPVLASRAAVRSGTGLVFLGVPREIYPIVAVKSDEAMPSPLPCDEQGKLTEEALVPVLEKMAGCDSALIGPGLSLSEDMQRLVSGIMDTVQYPLVLDADGINAIAGHMDVLYRRRGCPTLLTPHDGEFARLGGDLSDGDRVTAARRFSMTYGCLLILKGHRTIVSLPDGEVFVNTTGNAGMAKGGSGDVLAGILVSLLAQSMHPVKAAVCAVWIHGRAGDLCKARLSERAMTPTDVIGAMPEVFLELE